MKNTEERVIYVDLLKVFAIFLVVWGHCMQHLSEVPTSTNAVFLWISSFHMPLFMSLAGLFAERTFNRPFKDYLSKRSKQLLLPWISWSLILLTVIFLLDGKRSISDVIRLFFNSLWFLKSLFICGILALIGFKPNRNRVFWIIVSFILSQILLVWNVSTMYPCFLFGILCSKNMERLLRNSKTIAIISGIMFFGLSIIAANSPSFWMRDLGIRAMLIDGQMSISDMFTLILSVALRRYAQVLLGCIGALFFISLFSFLFSNRKNSLGKSMARFGQFTLGVYVIQTLIVETLMPRLFNVDSQYAPIFNWIIAPCISAFVVFICLHINMIIENRGGIYPSYYLAKSK